MADRPLITIVMPNLNGAKYLRKSIQSFLAQDYPNKELIIVDGKSTDQSHEIIREYSSVHKEVTWIQRPDRGISDAINIGIDYSRGEIIGYLGSDDLLYKDVFNEIDYASSWCDFDAIYFNSFSYFINEKRCVLRKCPDLEFNKENLLRYGTIVGLQNIFFHRRVYDTNRYDVNIKYAMDYEFYLRISRENYLYLYVDRVATINILDGNISLGREQSLEACDIALKYAEGYRGPLCYSKNQIPTPKVQGTYSRIAAYLRRYLGNLR